MRHFKKLNTITLNGTNIPFCSPLPLQRSRGDSGKVSEDDVLATLFEVPRFMGVIVCALLPRTLYQSKFRIPMKTLKCVQMQYSQNNYIPGPG